MSDVAQTADPYAQIAEFYDLEHDKFDDDVPFFLNSIAAVGDPVLELGCGTGRLLRPIAGAGYRVTGIDQSGPMLSRARVSLGRQFRDRVTLVHGSMSDFSDTHGGPFGTIIFGLNGLLHLTDPFAQRRAIASAKAALDPRGQLLIDVINPTFETLRAFDRSVVHEGAWKLKDGSSIEKFSIREVSNASQLIRTRIWYDIAAHDGTIRRVSTEFNQRYVTKHELALMLELEGFVEWQVYGSYELDPYDDDAPRLIIAAELTAS
jgi:SAM-dependent methyltransferase